STVGDAERYAADDFRKFSVLELAVFLSGAIALYVLRIDPELLIRTSTGPRPLDGVGGRLRERDHRLVGERRDLPPGKISQPRLHLGRAARAGGEGASTQSEAPAGHLWPGPLRPCPTQGNGRQALGCRASRVSEATL